MSLDLELNQLRALAKLSRRDYVGQTRRVKITKVRPWALRRFWSRLGAYAPLERRLFPPDVIHAEWIEALRRETQDLPRDRLPSLARLLAFDGRTYVFTDESDRSVDDPPVLAFRAGLQAPRRLSVRFVEYAAHALLAQVLPLSPDRVVTRTPARARPPLPTCQPRLLLADQRLYLPLDLNPAAAEGRWYSMPLPKGAERFLAHPPHLLAQEIFAFLIEEHGLTLDKAYDRQRESGVVYTSPRTRVSVYIDHLPLGVSVAVGLYEQRGKRRLVDQYALVDLVHDRAPDQAAQLGAKAESLEQALTLNAALLRRHAADFLGGASTRVARLRRLRADKARRRNKADFGTSTGETPRFAQRPTLEQLFADATNEGLHSPRAYQAHWDYGYSLAEIARFLEQGPEQVQALLDQWDRI